MTTRLAALIEGQITSGQPIQLGADAITLTGSVLRLSGHVRFQFGGTLIRADEAIVRQDTRRVELIGIVTAMLSSEAARAMGVQPPRLEYK